MSSSVDDRARAAASAMRAAVAAADLHLMEAGPAARPSGDPAPPGRWALAGAVAAAVIVVGLFAGPSLLMAPAGPGITAPPDAVATTPPTTTTTSPVAAPVAPSTTQTPPSTAAAVAPPLLEVTHPADGSVVEVELLTFRGIAEPGARVFSGPYEAKVNSDGRWELALVLAPGTNTVRFTAGDTAGNGAEASVTVVYRAPVATTTTTTKPATTTTTKTEKAEVAGFTAVSVYGSCSEDPPYDDYRGTGEPGSTVWVASAYGSASTLVREDGTWEVRVVFAGAPTGVPFEVKAKDDPGRKVRLQFTALTG